MEEEKGEQRHPAQQEEKEEKQVPGKRCYTLFILYLIQHGILK